MPNTSGRHFLQVPGPSNVPDRILRAIARPTIDHRGPEFGRLALELLDDLKPVFKTAGKVMIFPSSGTGAWEAGIVNTLSPGDKVLMFETGQFATLWKEMAVSLGLEVQFVASDWRHGADQDEVESILREDRNHQIKAVCVVHNETSSAVTNSVPAMRKAMDRAKHPALLMVDTISSLGFDGFPARRVGRGCGHRRFAEGTDAAARAGVQRGERKSSGRREIGADAEIVLGLAGHARPKQERLLPLHARHQPALWAAGVAPDAA